MRLDSRQTVSGKPGAIHNVIKHKIGLLNLAVELGTVSRACKVMGFSRGTFYLYQAAVETDGVDALIDAS